MNTMTWRWIAILGTLAASVAFLGGEVQAQCHDGGSGQRGAGGVHNHGGVKVKQDSKPQGTDQPAVNPPAADQPVAPADKAKFANIRCPIMGDAIDPAKVPNALIREYKDQKIAFCCAKCPPAWDKLSDEQKEANLKAAVDPKK